MPKNAMRSPHWKPVRQGPRTFGTKYLHTVGKQVLSIAICDRCKFKFPYEELQPDPQFPGLRVCAADADWRDPYRLPARQTETITLQYPRPDEPVALKVTQDEQYSSLEVQEGNGDGAVTPPEDLFADNDDIALGVDPEPLILDDATTISKFNPYNF